jgi:hypothetical protein
LGFAWNSQTAKEFPLASKDDAAEVTEVTIRP